MSGCDEAAEGSLLFIQQKRPLIYGRISAAYCSTTDTKSNEVYSGKKSVVCPKRK